MNPLYQIEFPACTLLWNIKEIYKFSQLQGKVFIIVNVACDKKMINQFKGLESLYQKYNRKGLEILAFPCDEFVENNKEKNRCPQEIASFANIHGANEISEFCIHDYAIINGDVSLIHPVYQWLRENVPSLENEPIKNNFEKFLVNRNGEVAIRYPFDALPEEMEVRIKEFLDLLELALIKD